MNARLSCGCLTVVGCLVFVGLARVADAAAVDVQFSNFTIGETFPNSTLPRTIVGDDGTEIELTKYNGATSSNARILNRHTTGTDPALFLAANARAEFLLPNVAPRGVFHFRNYGGANLLEINGETLNFTNSALAGNDKGFVGGVAVRSFTRGDGWRAVEFSGLAQTLAFIGQELAIDEFDLEIGLPGDFNSDRTVDAADYVHWRKLDGSTLGAANLRRYFGVTVGLGSGGAVPEPSGWMLGITTVVFGLVRMRPVGRWPHVSRAA